MKILFLQSADASEYRRFLDVTSETVKEYCSIHQTDYECYMGMKRGVHPWHAALNRIAILKSHVDQGFDGWVIYLDADAYIADLGFDIRAYLSKKSDVAIIAAPSGVQPPRWWDVNNGVVAFNLAHPLTCALIKRWHQRLMMNSDEELASETKWGMVVDDQHIFHESLMDTAGMENGLYRDEGDGAVFNWNNRFIRQRVRLTGTLASRLSGLSEMVGEVLRDGGAVDRHEAFEAAAQVAANAEFVTAIYEVLLGRQPDQGGFEGVMRALKRGERTYSQELEACMRSAEYKARLPSLLLGFMEPHELENLVLRIIASTRSSS